MSLPDTNETVVCEERRRRDEASEMQTTFRLYLQPSISLLQSISRLSIVVSTVSGSLRLQITVIEQANFLSLLMQPAIALQAGRGQGVRELLHICKQKETTVYSPV